MVEDGERSNEGESEPRDQGGSEPKGESASKIDAEATESAGSKADAEDESDAVDAEAESSKAEGTESAEDDDSATDDTTSADTKPGPTPAAVPRRRTSKLWWALPILMVVEFYFYGHNGRLEICVGKEGDTDFALVGQERTDENRWKFPRCETRLNLGLRSQKEVKIEEGTKVACRGATIFRHQGEAKACVAADKGWVHRVEGHFVAPWEPAYYQHLFWFLQ